MDKYDLITSVMGSRSAVKSEDIEDVNEKESDHDEEFSPRMSTSRNKLISILAENSSGCEESTRKPICIEPKPPRRRETVQPGTSILQVHLQRGNCGVGSIGIQENINAKYAACGSSAGKQKIPRPANAFMLFANEWRKKLAIQNPRESNKDISVRLGVLWKNMAKGIKEKYFALAREVDAEHKRKYPDYVYNPKEARLRKAMREQSRELSRQSILQTAIASTSGTGSGTGPAGNVSSGGVVTSSSFLNHPLTCSSSSGGSGAAVSSLQNNGPSVNTGRIINPWFPVGPTSSSGHLKPIISPRIMAAHQRTLEKTKEAMRKQVECAAAGVFSSGGSNPGVTNYGGDFSGHNNPGQSPNDYCIIAEFGDGQKWHPYQNGGNPYHGRGTPMSKVGLHPNPNMHGPWAQFCGLPLQPSAPAATQNPAVIRPPRQMVFLQEQQGPQHCAFPTDEMQMAYAQNKIEVNPRLHPGYSGQAEPQTKVSAVSSPQMQQHQESDVKCVEVSQNWDTSGSTGGGVSSGSGSGSGTVVNSLLQGSDNINQVSLEEENIQQEINDDTSMARQKPISSKQPLPGFHQAFGSTEIGRFSRSEFFANMVGENSNTIPEAYLSAPVFPFSPTRQNVLGTSTISSSVPDEDLFQMIPEDCYWLGGNPGPLFGHNQNFENATNYAAFLDYSHRLSMNQEWLHPGSTGQEYQASFIEQPSLFHENSCSLLGHEHLTYGNYPCPSVGYDQQNINRQTSTSLNNGIINEVSNFNEFIDSNQQQIPQSKESLLIKQNDQICVMLEANQTQPEKDI